ncbi:hypothetical protein ANN_19615 [Periplaneta americana]|uniref:Uncharacterized protein n=1 Tax=Periplaneta americana TaxID=6978 RepID=A0ABQ8SAD9_PERAM|nr:hypothetical protein ANN_19615 [Periplaneta americana]
MFSIPSSRLRFLHKHSRLRLLIHMFSPATPTHRFVSETFSPAIPTFRFVSQMYLIPFSRIRFFPPKFWTPTSPTCPQLRFQYHDSSHKCFRLILTSPVTSTNYFDFDFFHMFSSSSARLRFLPQMFSTSTSFSYIYFRLRFLSQLFWTAICSQMFSTPSSRFRFVPQTFSTPTSAASFRSNSFQKYFGFNPLHRPEVQFQYRIAMYYNNGRQQSLKWVECMEVFQLNISFRIKSKIITSIEFSLHYPDSGFAEQSDGITVFRISTMTTLMLHRCRTDDSTKISQNLASVAQTTTCTAAMIAIQPSSSFVPISLQREVIVVNRSGEIRNTLEVILRRFINSLGYLASERDKGDNAAREKSPGSSTESYPAFAHNGLRENPGKSLNQALLLYTLIDITFYGSVTVMDLTGSGTVANMQSKIRIENNVYNTYKCALKCSEGKEKYRTVVHTLQVQPSSSLMQLLYQRCSKRRYILIMVDFLPYILYRHYRVQNTPLYAKLDSVFFHIQETISRKPH